MARGGRRTGLPNRMHPQRTDLALGPKALPVQSAPGQQYGQRAAQEEAQRAVPMGRPAPDLYAPTSRPAEPVTAGAPLGPGPGTEALGMPQALTTLDELRIMYRTLADVDDQAAEEIRQIIEELEIG